MPAKQFYDGAFAELFHHPKFIRSLLLDFIDEEWIRLIDLDSMQIEESKHKGMDERPLRSDMVISFDFLKEVAGGEPTEFPEGTPAEPPGEMVEPLRKVPPGATRKVAPGLKGFSIYLLMEFQSSPEPMSLRLLEYLVRLYRRQKGRQLHPVIPIVLYSGIIPWREKPAFEAQFTFIPDSLRPYLPLYRYILIDEGRYEEQLLRKFEGEVASFFLIDTADLEDRDEAAERIIGVLREMRERDPEIYRLLSRYVEGVLEFRGIENKRVEAYIERRRKPMLAQRVALLKEKGREEGYGQGELQDKQKVLIRQLSIKFSLSSEEKQLILNCKDSERLDEALDVILFADTKEAVLKKLR